MSDSFHSQYLSSGHSPWYTSQRSLVVGLCYVPQRYNIHFTTSRRGSSYANINFPSHMHAYMWYICA